MVQKHPERPDGDQHTVGCARPKEQLRTNRNGRQQWTPYAPHGTKKNRR